MTEHERWLDNIPTRYPNGLPGGIPADAYAPSDAERAIGRADAVLELVASRITGATS